MDSSDSLELDENLARFLSAFDQEIHGGDPHAPTVNVPLPSEPPDPSSNERLLTPMHASAPNIGSRGEVFPDSQLSGGAPLAPVGLTPAPGGAHRIGRFELRRQLGKGGCGIVFLAYDPKLQREVALKLPRPEMLMNPDAKRRLIREGLAAAEFDHPNLVPVYETGEIGPVCFIATAFCPGRTLAEWLDRQAFPVPVRQAARLVAIVAEAVQHAHDRGVLHRDLKPNNVILQEMQVEENDEPPPGSVQLRGEHLIPRLVDFGLAKLAERGGPSETGTRQILGTPKYMAPEQAQARREDIGPPADVYALGVILYEMMTGRAPYDGASDIEVLRQSVEGKPVAPRALRPDVPRDLEAICLKAMARTTTERYRTAIDLADDLRRFLDERPTIARPLAWSGRAARWVRRNDQFVAIFVLTIVIVFVTALGALTSYQTWRLQRDRASAQRQQATRDRAEQEREYSRQIREAFLAWRSGNSKAASAALDGAARSATMMMMEQTEFTHAYLTRALKAERLMIVCPAGPVTALAVSPDGTRLASGHANGTLAVWDRATGRQLGSVKADEGEVTHIGFGMGGSLVISAGRLPDRTPAMLGWSVTRDGTIAPAMGHLRVLGQNVSCFAVAPDGSAVFAGGHGGLLLKRRFAEPTAVVARASAPGQAPVLALAVAPDGKRLFTAEGGAVRCWTAELRPDPSGGSAFGGDVTTLAVSADAIPAIGLGGNVVLTAPLCVPLVFPVGGRVHWVATSGRSTAHNGAPGRIHIGIGRELATGDTGDVRAGAFSPDGKTLFTGSTDGVIRAWDAVRDPHERGATAVGQITALSVSANGNQFVVADKHHVTRFVGPREGQVAGDAPGRLVTVRLLETGAVREVVLDGRAVLVRDLTGNASEERLRTAPARGRTPTTATLTPDGAYLAVGDDAGGVTLWSLKDRNALGTLDTGVRPVTRVAFSDDGRFVAAPTPTGVGVWTVAQPELVGDLPADNQAVFRVLSLPDRIAIAGRDGVVRVWTFTGREELTMFGHVGRVTGLGASPDGRTLVSGGATGEVKFWDTRTGVELIDLRRHSTPVTLIEFADNGKVMVTAGAGQFAVWDARE